MEPIDPEALERLVESVIDGARYRNVCRDAVIRIGARELKRRKTWKEAEKETRNRLHQISGAFLEGRPHYTRWIQDLREAPDEEIYRSELRRIMHAHASTHERLSRLETFYSTVLETIRPVHSVIDIACGFNPLSLPWMGLAEGASYTGFDLFSDMAAFTSEAMRCPFSPEIGVQVETCDLVAGPPTIGADLALVQKFLPILQSDGDTKNLDWLRGLRTRHALITFPTRTLGGRNVGMSGTYAEQFNSILAATGWASKRYELAGELCFLVELNPST